jgi:hypothetical protein
MEVKYAIMLILLGYLLLIGACWKFCIIPKMKFLEENQNQNQNRNRILPETQAVPVVPDIP